MGKRQVLRGIVPPMVTPLLGVDRLDVASTERLVEHVLAGGVHGLFVLGTTGEAPNLAYGTRHELVRTACRRVAGRVPVLVGVTDTVFAESLRLAETAAEEGAAAVVAASPYYFPPGQPELVKYFRDLADRSPLPVYLYNMPSHVKVMLDLDTVLRLAEHPNIVGVKDSSGNVIFFNNLRHALRDRPDFGVFIGPEEGMAESVLMGANGGVNGGANLFPKLYVDLYAAAAAKDVDRVRELQPKVMAVATSFYGVGRHSSSLVKGVKCALKMMGVIGSDMLAEPAEPFAGREREIVAERLAAFRREWPEAFGDARRAEGI